MKTIVVSLITTFLYVFSVSADAQFNIGNAIKNKAINKTNQSINKVLDKGVDNVLKKKDKAKKDSIEQNNTTDQQLDIKSVAQGQQALQTYSKYDFIPGEKVIFFDDFSQDKVGDFPALWNTDGSGEVVTTNLYPGHWLKITNNRAATCLESTLTLPENYTIEFDAIPQKDPSNAGDLGYSFYLMSTPKPNDIKYGGSRPGAAAINLKFAYYNYYFTYFADGSPSLDGHKEQFRQIADRKYKISIWVQKERIRVYQDENKLWDLPKAISKNYKYNMIRFQVGVPMISNIRIAVGTPDMRSKLMTEGKLVSYGIYFDVNKDVVKPESYGTLKGIADVLNENPAVRVKIVGHTDNDGADVTNLDLSKRRGISVKNELVKSFGVDASRLESDGMGENQPVVNNDSPANKAMNRRVEFIKL